jgi:regulator of sigma E protease
MRQVGISHQSPTEVGFVVPGSPAELAGLVKGQQIIKLNGNPVYSPLPILETMKSGAAMELTLRNADGSEVTTSLTPVIPTNWQGLEKACPILGFTWGGRSKTIETVHPGVQAQINQSFRWMGETLAKVAAPGSSVGVQHLSGPVGIGNYLYQMLEAENGWKLILWFAVVLNVNLAVLNILPLPIVDGGHVVLGTLEIIFRRPVGGKILEWIQTGFMFLILTFFLFVTCKDVGDMVGGEDDAADKLPAPVFSK